MSSSVNYNRIKWDYYCPHLTGEENEVQDCGKTCLMLIQLESGGVGI